MSDEESGKAFEKWASMSNDIVSVPCGGCTRCCRGDAVRLTPHEDASKWKTEPHPYINGALMLAHKENDDCYYLGTYGCTIHNDKPLMCRQLDCRLIATKLTFTQARKLAKIGAITMELWKRGRELARETGGMEYWINQREESND